MTSLALRALSLGSKFVLLMVMARYLTLESVGHYGLGVAAVDLLSRVVGLEFHATANRDLVRSAPEERWSVLNSQLLVAGGGALLGIAAGFGAIGAFDLEIGFWLFPLLLTHQTSVEATRVLIALGKPLLSYVVGAVTHGIWPLATCAAWILGFREATLEMVWSWWLLGNACGSLLGVYLVIRSVGQPYSRSWCGWAWTKEALLRSREFVFTAASFRLIELSDRFVVDHFLGVGATGMYTYYSGFAKLLIELPTVLLVAPFFPKLVTVMRDGDRSHALGVLRSFALKAGALSAVAAPVLFVGLWAVSVYLDRGDIWGAPGAFALLLAAMTISALSLGGHYALYGADRDRQLALSTTAAAAVGISVGVTTTPMIGVHGAALGTLCAMVTLAISKTWLGLRTLDQLP